MAVAAIVLVRFVSRTLWLPSWIEIIFLLIPSAVAYIFIVISAPSIMLKLLQYALTRLRNPHAGSLLSVLFSTAAQFLINLILWLYLLHPYYW